MGRRFNDGYYAVSITEWEQECIPDVVWYARAEWSVMVVLAGICLMSLRTGGLSSYTWREWVACAFVAFLCLQLFTFLHEINENLRFVRHKLAVQRYAFKKCAEEFGECKHPEAVSAVEILNAIAGNWDD